MSHPRRSATPSRTRPRGRPGALGIALAGFAVVSCTVDTAPSDAPTEPVAQSSMAIHSSHAGSPPWTHVLTCYGGCSAPHYDPSACNHHTSCGPIANGTWWYATERAAFHCGAKLKLVRGNKCVVVDVEDNGPADWVEDNALTKCGTPYIIDTSPLVADYFGGGCGWGECFLVEVSPVPDNTPTGPGGCTTCECTPGQTQSDACGNCGTRTRTCQSNCAWGGWSSCQGQGPCAAGQHESRDCCDCGAQTRSCSNACQWNAWSACKGPDPAGGEKACDTGETGPCAQGTVRCLDGCTTCVRLYEPISELCNDVDDDCSGETDDGNPASLGNPPPAFAATLHDSSLPQSLPRGEPGRGWAAFRNEGTSDWRAGTVWLASAAALGGAPSPVEVPGEWPSWDVAAVLDSDVAPGALAFFDFAVTARKDTPARVHDNLVLIAPDGSSMKCPSPSIEVDFLVTDLPATGEGLPAAQAPPDDTGCGCRTVSGGSSGAFYGWCLLLATLAFRRNRPVQRSPGFSTQRLSRGCGSRPPTRSAPRPRGAAGE